MHPNDQREEDARLAGATDAPLAAQHRRIWRALDAVAASQGLSASSLAKLAGLDATAFNPSKRVARDGRLRWPGVETLTKVAEATGMSLGEIVDLMENRPPPTLRLPHAELVGSEAPGALSVVDGADEHAVFAVEDAEAFALTLRAPLPPLYRSGDRLVLSPQMPIATGDRAMAAQRPENDVAALPIVAGVVLSAEDDRLQLASFDGAAAFEVDRRDCAWVARIVWASQ